MAEQDWIYLDTGEVFEAAEDGFANTDRLVCAIAEPQEERGPLIAAAPMLLRKVEIAATIFDEYARLHRAKGTRDGDVKAKRNEEYAEEMRLAAAEAREP